MKTVNTKVLGGIIILAVVGLIVLAGYMRSIRTTDNPGALPLVYSNEAQGFSIRYPEGYTLDANYNYTALGPSKTIGGVKLTIPSALASGTNLSSDSYLSIEEIPATDTCSAGSFLEPGAVVTTMTENGVTYSTASTIGAGAGNRYEETVYAIPGTNPCIAVRYMVHYGVIENYPSGSVREFDKGALLSQFDAMRLTLVILDQR